MRVAWLAAPALLAVAAACGPHGGAGEPGRAAGPTPAAGRAARAAASPAPRLLDDFESPDRWTAHPSDGVELRISSDTGRTGRALRLDFDFRGGSGYAIARRELPLELPENYEFAFWLRADAPVNDLEFKLVDPTGENVWWVNRRRFEYPREWTRIVVKKRHIEFAWGPAGGGDPERIAALEIVVTAATGGRGTVWVDDLTFRELDPPAPYTLTPVATASGHDGAAAPALVLDGDPATAWRSARSDTAWLALDFLREREFGGLVLDWHGPDHATHYEVQVSPDGERWETIRVVEDGNGGRDHLWLPESEARHLRLRLTRSARGQGYALAEVAVQPIDWAPTRNDFFMAVARDARRGDYPRAFLGEQSYWTVVGVDADTAEGLLSEDGALEVGAAGFSIEPFIHAGGELYGWESGDAERWLERGDLPIPSVRRRAGPLVLTVTAFAAGEPGASSLYARYRVENPGATAASATLFLALRPFQVNPPWQFLNIAGGVARIRALAWDGEAVRVDGRRRVVPITPPAAFGAATFDQGDVVHALRAGSVPPRTEVSDPFEAASGALAYPLELAPGGAAEVYIAVPLHEASPTAIRPTQDAAQARARMDSLMEAVAGAWAAKLDRVEIRLPPAGREVERTLRTVLAHILINRDGPAIQPGSRSYSRSWIRDGSLTSAALLRLGQHETVREFTEWYAPYQFPDGKVPCCVERLGAGPVPEHDSHGQLIYLIAEYYRHTGDRALVERLWPHVEKAAAYIDALRRERMTPEYLAPEKRAFYGMLPQSISHEGYSAKPMHSYWDDLFALLGLKDAAFLAGVLGRRDDAARLGALRDEFRGHLVESYQRAMAMHGIDYLPGAVELGDFDATSTTVALAPVDEAHHLPAAALVATFDRYLREFRERRDGAREWEAYTPYELRSVGTMVRMGRKAEAHELLDYFLRDRRPTGWNQWAEVVWREYREPKFIGDTPHTWVGSDFIRSVLDMFAYERGADSALVVGAGVPAVWVAGPGLRVRGLGTHYGPLDLDMRMKGDAVRVRIAGPLRIPRGGIVLRSPLDRPIGRATVNGAPEAVTDDGEFRIRRVPADIVLEHR
ncbi:MAG TPA: discoidin domain-containing protein [Longimicrobiales bacterium]